MGYTVSVFKRPEDRIYKLYNEPVCRKLDFSILDNDCDIRRRRLSVFQPHQRRSSPRRFNPRSQLRPQPRPRPRPQPRRRHPLIDDSAIESDGEGGDISSTATTPERPSPPPRKPNKVVVKFRSIPRPPSPKPLPVKRTIVKFEKTCDLCGLLVEGKRQFERHRGNKKCLRRQEFKKTISPCGICARKFDTRANKKKHISSKHK